MFNHQNMPRYSQFQSARKPFPVNHWETFIMGVIGGLLGALVSRFIL